MKSSKKGWRLPNPVEQISRAEHWRRINAGEIKDRSGKKRQSPEFKSQSEFISIVRHPRNMKICPDLEFVYANGNGGLQYKAEAGKRKAEGVLPGVSDLTIPSARHGFGGLYIENKSLDGSLSTPQKKFRDYILTQNYCFKLCRTPDEQCDVIEWYFDIKLDRLSGLVR